MMSQRPCFLSTRTDSFSAAWRITRHTGCLVLALSLIGLAGCGPAKLNETKEWTLDGEAKVLELPAVSKPQTITVVFSASSGEVSVLLFKADDAKGESAIVEAPAIKALGSKLKSKGDTFTVEVPENTATRLFVRPVSLKAVVKVTVTNQK